MSEDDKPGYVAEVDMGPRIGVQRMKFESYEACQEFVKSREKWLAEREKRRAEYLAKYDWESLSMLCNSEERIPTLAELWGDIPPEQRSVALVEFYGAADFPSQHTEFLSEAFRDRRVLDGKAAQKAFEDAPQTLTIYRGTTQAELDDRLIGISWTTDRSTADFFATKHSRFRMTESPPVLLTADIDKSDVRGWFWDRKESEVVITSKLDYEITQLQTEEPPQ